MAIQMRRGNKANLDKTKLVAGEIAVSLDTKEVSVSDGNGDTIDLATKDDLQNIIKLNGGVTIDENTLVISPEEETTEEQGTPVDIESISIDGGMTDNPIKDATARADISSVGGRVTTLEGKIGANNGIATLNGTGKVPESQLPSYVDDVIEGYLYNGAFYEDSAHTTLITGESGKIYVDLSTDKTYRWSGTVYVCTGSSLELGETQGTAYEGSKGKANADNIADIQSVIPANASTSNKLATMEDVEGGEAVWGGITGSLNDQTDLKAALDNKYDIDDALYGDIDESCDIPFSTNTTPKRRKVSFSDFRNKITNKFYTFLRETVGFTTKNIADTSKAEIGVNGAGTANSLRARLIVPCEGSTSYRVTSSGTNNFTQIDYMTTDTLPPSGGYSGISFPTTITTHESDKYIVFVFKKSTDVTQSDVDALKMMVKESSVTDDTYEPYHASVDVAKANRDEVKDVIGWSGKNLLNKGWVTQTINGITFTANEDGSVTVNGTASGLAIMAKEYLFKAGDSYILSGCPSGGSDSTYRLDVNKENFGANDYGSGTVINIPSDGTYNVRIRVPSGSTVNNLLFKPMLRDASIADDTYEPYHASVEQTLRDAEVIEGKNKLENKATSTGIFTVNADKTVTVNSNASSDVTLDINSEITISESMILSGCPSGGSGSKYQLVAKIGSTYLTDSGSGVELSSGTYRIYILVKSGYGNGLVFKPMLCTKDEWEKSHDFEPYYIPLKDSKFDRSEQRVLGAKNLLQWGSLAYNASDNLVCTESDEEVSIVGTKTAGHWGDVRHRLVNIVLKKGIRYKATCGSVPSDVKGIRLKSNGTFVFEMDNGASEGYYTPSNDIVIDEWVTTFATNDEVANIDMTYYPMLVLATDPDSTYAPYAMTNRELTEAIQHGGGGGASWGDITGTLSNQTDLQNALNAKADDTDIHNGSLSIQQNGVSAYGSGQSFDANSSDSATANIVTDDWVATGSVQNGSVTFNNIDDTNNYGYKPWFIVTDNSTEMNPTYQLTSLIGAGTSSMSVTYSTSADDGTNNCKLRRIK